MPVLLDFQSASLNPPAFKPVGCLGVPGMAHLPKVWCRAGPINPPLPDGRITPTVARALLETECLKEA